MTSPSSTNHKGVPAQEDGGATIVEIGQQPDAWREVAGRSDGDVDSFLRDVLNRPNLRVILTGAGSSAFASRRSPPPTSSPARWTTWSAKHPR
jgi:tagatose-6-phosphate ketose/aldose isomerase